MKTYYRSMDAGTVVSDLDLTGIAPGTYFIRVKFADGSIVTRKIVKMP